MFRIGPPLHLEGTEMAGSTSSPFIALPSEHSGMQNGAQEGRVNILTGTVMGRFHHWPMLPMSRNMQRTLKNSPLFSPINLRKGDYFGEKASEVPYNSPECTRQLTMTSFHILLHPRCIEGCFGSGKGDNWHGA